jgi:hypothetical protein
VRGFLAGGKLRVLFPRKDTPANGEKLHILNHWEWQRRGIIMSSGTYQDIWDALKKNTKKEIVVRCNPEHMETLIQAVKKIKSTENAARKRLDDPSLPHWGRLKVAVDKRQGTVKFSLTYSLGDLL